MMNIYLRLFVIAILVLVALAVLHVIIPLILTAALAAAIVMGVLFLINLFRRKPVQPPAPYQR